MHELQFGFHIKHSTNHALLHFTEVIIVILHACSIFIDLQCQQFVSVNGFNSTKQTMRYGIPEGSVLGALLFLIYINDLNKAIKFSTTRHFADDTNLLFVGKSLKKIQKYVNYDLNWYAMQN